MYTSIQASSDFFGNNRSFDVTKRNRIISLITIFEGSIVTGAIFTSVTIICYQLLLT